MDRLSSPFTQSSNYADNSGVMSPQGYSCISELFEAQSERTPDAIALTFEDQHLTYFALNQRANQLAHYLRGQGVDLEVRVGVCLERSVDLVVSLLAILKAGGAYVPLDPATPQNRIRFMLQDADISIVVTHASVRETVADLGTRVVCLDANAGELNAQDTDNPASHSHPLNAAYVMYTSGSTGQPKGISIPHQAVTGLVIDANYVQCDTTDVVAQVATCAFDAATFEMWGALLNGSQLIILKKDIALSPSLFAADLEKYRVTVLFLTTALFNHMARENPSAFKGVRSLLFGGEQVDPALVLEILTHEPPKRLLHVYGPTETTTYASWHMVKNVEEGDPTVPIGRPVSRTQLHVLDASGRAVSAEDSGELYIGGSRLARSYLGQPALTAARFVPNPFGEDGGERLYKTGDQVRQQPDGPLEFIGRNDYQIKLRGFRIELGEIEAALRAHPAVKETVVVVWKEASGDKHLVAYLTLEPATSPSASVLREYLKDRIPEYMVPAFFVPLDQFPLTQNGKIDRQALPAPNLDELERGAPYAPPATEMEQALVDLYQEVLRIERVGIHDDFLALGGHSLRAMQIIARIEDVWQVLLPLDYLLKESTVAQVASYVEAQRQEPRDTSLTLRGHETREGPPPLSFSQERVWFLEQLHPGNLAYYFQALLRFKGPLSVPVLERSLTEIIRRHEIWRTTFVVSEEYDIPVQRVHPPFPVTLPVVDLQEFSGNTREEALQRIVDREIRKAYDVTQLPLVRWSLVRLNKEDYVLIHMEHHLVHDGWSINVFLDELVRLYKAFLQDLPSPLPEIPIQFGHFAHFQREWMNGATAQAQLAYWKQKLSGCMPVLPLPYDRPRPPVPTFAGAAVSRQIPFQLSEALHDFAKKEGSTAFMTLMTAFIMLLARYSGQQDFCLGTVFANRRWRETEGMLGMIINNVVLRADVSRRPTGRELLKRVRALTLEASTNQDIPFDHVVDAMGLARHPSINPLFQVLFGLHDSPMPEEEISDLGIKLELGLNNGSAKFDLTLLVVPATSQHLGPAGEGENQGYKCVWEYNTDLFDESTIAQMALHYDRVLAELITQPTTCIWNVPLLTQEQEQQQLVDWNDTTMAYPGEVSLPHLFEAQVAERPDAVAVVSGDAHLTYAQLDRRSNQLAHYLLRHGVGPEVRVGVCLERGIDLVVGLLAILKAGGAYVPLDPSYPTERLAYMLADAQAPVLLTQAAVREQLPTYAGQVLTLQWETLMQESFESPACSTVPENLAYVLYTSGSTGQPKGVMIAQKSVVSFVHWARSVFSPEELAGVLASTSICFDLSVFELFVPLSWGGTVILAENTLQVMELPAVDRLTLVNAVPSAVGAILDKVVPSAVRTVNLAGEPLKADLVAAIYRSWGVEKVQDLYGPSEATTYATHAVRSATGPATIGQPVANTQGYVVDRYSQLVPMGVPGELYIGGQQVARGYLARPAMTAEKFVPHPFSEEPGARLYRTGDVMRYRSDGTLEFQGRQDHQVKVRGYRIELGEIETVVTKHAAVEESIVLVREDEPGEKRLVAYVMTDSESLDVATLRAYLQERLPGYMVPSAFVIMEAFPLTPNGKVDRQALPAPEDTDRTQGMAYVAPRTPIEETLGFIWREVLGLERVGVHDNFFELGGDSILGIQLVGKANKAGLRMIPTHIFQHQTIADLAAVVSTGEAVIAHQGVVTGSLPLTPVQHWFFEQQLEEIHHWNMAWLLEVSQPLDPGWMEQAVEAVVTHHDALRLRFTQDEQGWHQELGAPGGRVPFTVFDLSHLAPPEADHQFQQESARLHASLHLSNGPLIRVALFQFDPPRLNRILLVIHHLAVDGVSWRILIEDLQMAYNQLGQGRSLQLPPKTTSFKQWAERMVGYAESSTLLQEQDYWQEVLGTPCVPLPRDRDGGANTEGSTRVVVVSLTSQETQALLQDIPEVYHTHINDVLLTPLVDVLAQWTREDTVLLDLEGHGREDLFEDVDLSRTVGWFTSIFPVPFTRGNTTNPGKLLKSVKEQLRQIPNKGIGYGLFRYLSPDRDLQPGLDGLSHPDVVFNYFGKFESLRSDEQGWNWCPESAGPVRDPQGMRTHALELSGRIIDGIFQLTWRYSVNLHQPDTIKRLANQYLEGLKALIRHCQSPEAGGYTPSDFPLAKLDQVELDSVLTNVQAGNRKVKLANLYPLTPMQQGLWFHALAEPESEVYFVQSVSRIEGELDIDAFRQGWQEVIARHAILRTGLVWEGLDSPLQFVQSTVTLPWEQLDWREEPVNNEWHPRLRKLLDADRTRGFDLGQAPLMRLILIQVTNTVSIFVWSMHHVIMDRWSLELVQQEVWAVYKSLRQGQSHQFEPVQHYWNYLGWLQQQDLAQAENYWRHAMEGFIAPTVLGIDQAPARAGLQDGGYDTQQITLSEAVTIGLDRFARQHRLTLNTVMQGAWAVVLGRYSGTDDVVFGTTVSGRSLGPRGLEAMVGLFINTLPVRVRMSPSHTLVGWLTELQAQQVGLREYEYTPLFELQKWSEVPPGETLFNTLLVFENTPWESGDSDQAQDLGLMVQPIPERRGGEANYPLTVVLVPGRTLQLRFTYDTEHYTAEAITRMGEHFQQVLTGMVEATEQQLLGAVPLLTGPERQQLLVEWNATEAEYPRAATIAGQFETQVAATPHAVAVVFEEQQLTYAELNSRANHLAWYLHQQYDVGPEVCVGLCMERSVEMVVALLGILKAGGAYVPLDPDTPRERMAFMLEDADIAVVLTQDALKGRLPDEWSRPVVALDGEWSRIEQTPADNLTSGVTADNLAYIMYTSGSTGVPKGTSIRQRSVVRLVTNTNYLDFGATETLLQFAPLAFDASTLELWGSLLHGARLVIFPPHKPSLEELGHCLQEHGISTLWLTAAMFHQMVDSQPEALRGVRQLLAGGDVLSVAHVQRVVAHLPEGGRLINGYGPTENTTFTCCHVMTGESAVETAVPIGRPIANTQVYVLDPVMQPVPVGVYGELHIGGDGLARDYLQRPTLTAERFVPHPFSPDPGGRLYRTGDMVRYRSDGTLEFRGRQDHQIKLRGYRIELGEIEAVLMQHPAIAEAVGLVREDEPGEKRLVAYIVPAEAPLSVSELRQYLKQHVPDYMVPAHFVMLDVLPLTRNGKVDRKRLPIPEGGRGGLETEFIAPQTPTQMKLAGIWRDVLNVERVGVHDNFFELGGHSLLATQVVSRVYQAFEVNLKLRYLFEMPTIARMAESIETLQWKAKVSLPSEETGSPDRTQGRI